MLLVVSCFFWQPDGSVGVDVRFVGWVKLIGFTVFRPKLQGLDRSMEFESFQGSAQAAL